jgi:hypothetical protein
LKNADGGLGRAAQKLPEFSTLMSLADLAWMNLPVIMSL